MNWYVFVSEIPMHCFKDAAKRTACFTVMRGGGGGVNSFFDRKLPEAPGGPDLFLCILKILFFRHSLGAAPCSTNWQGHN